MRGRECDGPDVLTRADADLGIVAFRESEYTSGMTTRILVAAAALALFSRPAMAVAAGEHPEHPNQNPPAGAQSGQANQTKAAEEKKLTVAQISTGIKKHITEETAKSSDKKLHVKHDGKDVALDLVKVHEDRLSSLGGGKYFACVDMKATDGTAYDIDFFLSGTPDSMKVTETSVHKVNGKALYSWKEEGGVWKKEKAS